MKRKGASKSSDFLENWESKAKAVYKDTMQVVRDGLHGLEVVAEKTMEVTRIRLSNQQALGHMKSLFTDLGQRVFQVLIHKKNNTIRIPPDVTSFVDQIKKFQGSIEDNIKKLRHLTVVGASDKTRKTPTKKTRRGKKASR